MQYSFVAILALAGAAIATPAQSTLTVYSTHVATITECPESVTLCPARTETRVATMTYGPGAAYPTGAQCPGCAYATGTGAYVKPTLSGYNGPAYTGAAGQVKAAGALAGVGAFAALLL